MRRYAVALLLLTSIVGCSALPEAGPATKAVEQGEAAGYQLVKLTNAVADALNQGTPAPADTAAFAQLPPGKLPGRITAGDELQLTLWEANPTGSTLLSPPGLQTTLRVDDSGTVLLPYIGTLRAAGETPEALQRRIQDIFQAQGHAIQAALLDAAPGGDSVVLAGDAARPGLYPFDASAGSLLDLIALGGGARDAADETNVRLQRGTATATGTLAAILGDPALDVALAPGDTVTLLPRRQEFYAFGAVNHPGMFPYDEPQIALVQALAETSGLQDERAEPRGVFIYRPGMEQTVYQLDLSQPQGFFVASRFLLQPGDVLYVSDAPVADVAKVLQTITGIGSVAVTPRDFGAPY